MCVSGRWGPGWALGGNDQNRIFFSGECGRESANFNNVGLHSSPMCYKSINPPEAPKRMYTIGDDSCYLVTSLLLLPRELFTFLRVEFGGNNLTFSKCLPTSYELWPGPGAVGLTGLWQKGHHVAILQYSRRCQCRGARQPLGMAGREDFLKEEELEQTVDLEKVAKGKGGEMRSGEEAPGSGQASGRE